MNQAGIIIVCQSCGARLKAGKSLIGKTVSCPKCQTKINVSNNLSDKRKSPDDSLLEKTTVAGSHFEDIDSLLQSQKENDSNSTPALPGTIQSGTTRPQTVDPHHRPGSAETAAPQERASKKGQDAQRPADYASSPSDDARSDRRFRGSVPASPKPSRPANEQGTTSAQRDPQAGTSAMGDTPLLPDDKWNHPAAQKRARLIKLTTFVIACLLLIGVGIALWMQPGRPLPTPSEQVAQNESDGSHSASREDDEFNPAHQAEADSQANLEIPTDSGEDIHAKREPEKPASEQPAPQQREGGQTKPGEDSIPTVNPLDSIVDGDSPPPLPTAGRDDPIDPLADQPPPELPSFPRTDPDQINSSPSANRGGQREPNSAEKERLAKLAELLDEGQLAISRFQYLIPEPREQRRIGPPKFVVNRSDLNRPDPQRQFAATCPKLTYQETPLSVIIDDLMTITGVPMTFDLGAVKAMTGVSNPLLSIDLDGPTLGDAIDAMLESISLSKVVNESQGVIITALHAEQLSLAKISLPKFSFDDPAEIDLVRQELVMGIQNMFAPQSWQAGGNLGRIWIEQNELLVNNSPLVHFQIQDLVDRIDAALVLMQTPADLPANQILQTRLSQLQPRLSTATGMQHTIARPLVQYLQQIQLQTGVTVFCDWESLAAKGWHAQTSIPGKLYGADLDNALRLLTETLDITYVAVDQNTVWLTTYEAAESMHYLEFYPLGTLTQEKLSQVQVLDIFNEVLGADFRQPGVQVIFEPRYGSLILIAPQFIHRRVETLLQEMGRL